MLEDSSSKRIDRDDSFNKNNKSNKDIEVKIKYVIVLCMIRYFDFSCTCC